MVSKDPQEIFRTLEGGIHLPPQIPYTEKPWILSATYGSAVVTAQLQAKLAKGITVFHATNGFIGFDPNPGVLKFLSVVYAYHGEILTEVAMENAATVAMPGAKLEGRMNLIYASYGPQDVTFLIQTKYQQGVRSFLPSNDFIGNDPQYGVVKNLTIKYEFAGQVQEFTVQEHSGGVIELP